MERKRSVRRKPKPPLAERAKDHCRAFTAFLFSNVGIIILVVLYMTAGAWMFIAIEGSVVVERWPDIARLRTRLSADLWNISSGTLNGLERDAFEEEVGKKIRDYQQIIVRAVKSGWHGSGSRSDGGQWTFSGAFLYSLTVITTIGYGNVAPRTEWGKVATILYAIIGMPLFLLYLSNIGDILAKSFKWIYAKVCLCRICPGVAKRRALRERRKIHAQRIGTDFAAYQEDMDLEDVLESISSITSSSTTRPSDGNNDDDNGNNTGDDTETDTVDEFETVANTVTVPFTICLMIIIGYIFIGGTIFSGWEGWESTDGSYFCFISLSSIGFGDIVPGEKIMHTNEKNISGVEVQFILCAVYLLLGMALIAMCFNLMQEQVIHKMQSFKRGIRRCFRCTGNSSSATANGNGASR